MKRIAILAAAALVAALAAGMMAGCSSQPASSASGSGSGSASASASASGSGSASASAASEQSQDAIIAELKDALNNTPAFESVTVTEDSLATFVNNGEAAGADSSASAASSEAASSESAEAAGAANEPATIATRTIYKFDENGDKVRTSMTCEIDDITLQYFTEGDNAVCVTDGPVYSGTVDQFEVPHAAGYKAYLKSATGDLNTIIDCVATVTKSQQDGMTVYELTLDPAKRIASDEIYQLLADSGDPILSESITVGFDGNNNLVWAYEKREFKASTAEKNLTFSDFDNTVVDPMPEANKTFEEMQADIDEKYDAVFAALEQAENAEGAAPSEAAAAK